MGKKVNLLEPVDVDKVNIIRDDYFHDAYIIDLPLTSMPDHVWLDIFVREWKSSRHLWDRKLFVMGDKLRLVTTAHDIEDKLDWVKQVIERTNKKLEEHGKELETQKFRVEEEEQKQRREAEEKEKARIEMIRATLRRRFGAI